MVILEISRTIFNILIVLGDIFVRKVALAYLKFSVITLTSPRMQTIYNELPRTIEKEEEEEKKTLIKSEFLIKRSVNDSLSGW